MADKTEQLQQVMALYNVFGPEAQQDRELKQQALAAQLERTNAMRLGSIADVMHKQQSAQLEAQRAQQMGPYYEALTQQALGGIKTPEERAANLANLVATTEGTEASTMSQLEKNRVARETGDSAIASQIAQNEATEKAAGQAALQTVLNNLNTSLQGGQYKSERLRQILEASVANIINQQMQGAGMAGQGTLSPEEVEINQHEIIKALLDSYNQGSSTIPTTINPQNNAQTQALIEKYLSSQEEGSGTVERFKNTQN